VCDDHLWDFTQTNESAQSLRDLELNQKPQKGRAGSFTVAQYELLIFRGGVGV